MKFWILSILAGTALAIGVNPGLKLEVKTSSLSYLTNVAVKLIELNLKNVKVPDVISDPGFFEYGVTGIQLDGFSVSSKDVKLSPVAGTGIKVEIRNAYVNLHGDYSYKLGIDKHSGQIKVQMSKFDMDLTVVLGMTIGPDFRGRPSIKTQSCGASVGSISTHFSGSVWNSIINAFRGLIDLVLKPDISKVICEQVQIDVDQKLDNTLRKMSLDFPIMNGIELDASLTRAPVVTEDTMAISLLGQAFLQDHTRPPYAPTPMPACPVTDRMFHAMVSEDMLNAALTAVYELGLIDFTVNRAMVEELSPANAHYLNISCTDFMCLGAMLPTVNSKFGGGDLWIALKAAKAPNMTFDGTKVTLNVDLNLDMRAEFQNESIVPIFDIDLAVGLELSNLNLETVNSTLYRLSMDVDSTTPQTVLKTINVGGVTADNLQGLFQFAVGFAVGKANDTISQGMNIPVDHHVMLEHTAMRVLQKAFFLAVDTAIVVQ